MAPSDIKSFAVIGGDLRQVHLAGLLAADGLNVFATGFDRDVEVSKDVIRLRSAEEAVSKANCVVLPLPYSVDETTINAPYARLPIPVNEVIGAAAEGTIIVGGKFDDTIKKLAANYKIKLVDYYLREELAVLNTIPTAEGAIQIAMEELPITIHGAKCLVAGFGRVAKTLANSLQALGAHVTVSARKCADIAWIKALGYNAVYVKDLEGCVKDFDVVFNTIPAVVFTESLLSKLKKDCLVIDIASKPGGVDFETAGRIGIKTVWALSLPGKVAPITAGAIIKDTVLNIINEEVSEC
jgi:dipicolinate synthase subunit A